MKNIRKGVFETNSSSMHSVHIEKGDVPYLTIEPDENGEILIEYGEFGWGPDTAHSPREIASYCLTATQYTSDEQASMEMLREVMEEHTGAKVKFCEQENEYYPKGYIDHQSTDTAVGVFVSKGGLKDLIFGRNSYVEIDNDNH